MKTNTLTRLYALAMSAVFASVATVGVAALMAASGEDAQAQFTASVPARHVSEQAPSTLTQWSAPAAPAAQSL